MTTLSINIDPLPWQRQILEPWPGNVRYTAVVAGIGSGKTYCGGMWLLVNRILRFQGVPNLLAANTYKQLMDATLPQFDKFLNAHSIPYKFARSPALEYTIFNTRIAVRSLENFDALRGPEYGAMLLDEIRDSDPKAWLEVLKGRLRHPGCGEKQEALIISTPAGYDPILYGEFFKAKKEGRNTDHRLITDIRTMDNKHLPRSYIESLQSSMTAELAEQELMGRFVLIGQGRVYYPYDPRHHEIESYEPDPARPLIHSWDFNVSPHITLVGQAVNYTVTDQNGTRPLTKIVWFDELVLRNVGTAEMCQTFIDRYGAWPGDVYVYGDSAGYQRSTSSNLTNWQIVIDQYKNAGINAVFDVPRNAPRIADRVNVINSLLRNTYGDVRFFHAPCCKMLAGDLMELHYKHGASVIDASDSERTHAADAAGYAAYRMFPMLKPRGWKL